MIDWSYTNTPTDIIARGVVDGAEVVKAIASHVPTGPSEPDQLRVRSLWVREDLRGDDAFATEVYLGLLAKVIELGYVTEDDLVDYEWTDEGVRVGNLRVLIPQDHDGREDTLRYRLISRGKVEEVAAKKKKPIKGELLDDEVAMVELKQELDAQRKQVESEVQLER